MRWDNTADARLFLAVLKVHGLKLNYESIAEHMGENCTAKAVSHRIAKLKDLGGSKPASAQSTPRKSPTKRKRNAQDDIVTVKKEMLERNLNSDASSEEYLEVTATGSPKKRKRQTKPVAIAPMPEADMSSFLTHADTELTSFVGTPDLYTSSEASSVLDAQAIDDYYDSFRQAGASLEDISPDLEAGFYNPFT